jgi:hypothetical protein
MRFGDVRVAAAIAASLCCGYPTGSAFAAELALTIEPADQAPLEVVVIPEGGIAAQLTSADGAYHGDVADASAPAWLVRYTVVARWSGGNEQLYLQLTQTTPPKIVLRLFHERPVADRATLDRIDALGGDLLSLLERYCTARYVYRTLPIGAVNMKKRALRAWYDAAYLLARDYAYFARDPDVTKFAEADGDRYFIGMNQQLLSFDWKGVSLVRQYLSTGDLAKAKETNDYFLAKLTHATRSETVAAAVQGVTADLLSKNATYLSTLSARLDRN